MSTDHKIKAYAFSVDDSHPWSFGESSPFGRCIGQAALLANDLLATFLTVYDANTVVGLHTQEELWFQHPVFAGERATLRGAYVEKYERRGKGHVVMEAEARGEDGWLLLKHRGIEILRVEPGPVVGKGSAETPERRVTGEYRKDVEPVRRARSGIAPGTPLVPVGKSVSQDQIAVFSLVRMDAQEDKPRSRRLDSRCPPRAPRPPGKADTRGLANAEQAHGLQ